MTQADSVLSTPPTNTSAIDHPMFPPIDPTRRRFLAVAAVASAVGAGTLAAAAMAASDVPQAVTVPIEADPIYQTILIAAEKRSGGRLGPAASRDRHPEGQEPPVSMPNWSRKPSPPGCPRKVYRRKPWRRKSLRLPQPTQVSPNRPWHQRTPSSGQGGAPERSKPRSMQPSHH